MTSTDSIVEKIKKLLRMKRGGTPGEIANAMAMAAELARKHNIDLNAVDPDAPEAKPISHAQVLRSARLQKECLYAGLVCQSFFNVQVLCMDLPSRSNRRWRDFEVVMIGTEGDRMIAGYIYHFLVGHFRRCWNRRENRRLRNRSAFMHGIYLGLCHKLHAGRVQETGAGLIRLDQQMVRCRQYMNQIFGATGEKTVSDSSDAHGSRRAGYAEGRRTEIRPAVNESAVAARPALPPANPQLALL